MLDPRDYDLRRLKIEASRMDCPNGPDEFGHWPCDPKGYFGIAECQVCGRIGVLREVSNQDASPASEPNSAAGSRVATDLGGASSPAAAKPAKREDE